MNEWMNYFGIMTVSDYLHSEDLLKYFACDEHIWLSNTIQFKSREILFDHQGLLSASLSTMRIMVHLKSAGKQWMNTQSCCEKNLLQSMIPVTTVQWEQCLFRERFLLSFLKCHFSFLWAPQTIVEVKAEISKVDVSKVGHIKPNICMTGYH